MTDVTPERQLQLDQPRGAEALQGHFCCWRALKLVSNWVSAEEKVEILRAGPVPPDEPLVFRCDCHDRTSCLGRLNPGLPRSLVSEKMSQSCEPASDLEPPCRNLVILLEIVRGRARNRYRSVEVPAFLIGTANDCDMVLGDSQFSDVHACLRITPKQVVLRHLGFSPEMTVNGEPVTSRVLQNGDRIRTGPYEFLVHIQPVEQQAPEPFRPQLKIEDARDRVEDVTGNQKVRELLEDIRADWYATESGLRVYPAPRDMSPPPVAAAILPASLRENLQSRATAQ